jgi:hypothetical protein
MTATGTLLIFTSVIVFALVDWGVKKAVSSKDFDSRIISQNRIFFVSWYALLSFIASKGYFEGDSASFPILGYIFLASLFVSYILSLTKIGEALSQLDWNFVVGFHGFRVLMELALYTAYLEDKVPIQMTFLGLNFNILAGVSAIIIAPSLAYRSRLRLIKMWNMLSLLLLFVFVAITIFTAKSNFQYFNANNNLQDLLTVPYIYIPGILVFFGFFGHWIVFKKIKSLED